MEAVVSTLVLEIHSASTEDAWAPKELARSRPAERAAAQNLSMATLLVNTRSVLTIELTRRESVTRGASLLASAMRA
jgi:hypothetical protein